ncbi:heterokaryon incompatibility [Trichoderma arundinaceum]|uniref:Heterokaryon incompatibility n=1 Tax=Trichoderma arundinaceum TaxID=490622 RepID=A0A395NW70_TRIAR|nr:heterokaryon incompatibility [Trichoderma arundinaceum]
MSPQRKRRSTSSQQSSSPPHHTKKAKRIARLHHYQPLDHIHREIRLLELLPGKPGSRIAARLLTVSLNDEPVYDALSYCWGAPRPTYDIFIHTNSHEDGHHDQNEECSYSDESTVSFPVGRNLRKALDDLRHQDEARLIWTDAICINQRDNLEKGHQIRLMEEIYTRARVVCAWLDHNVRPKSSAFDDLENLGRGVELDDFHDPSYWYPVADIFRNPYWRRLWIQQELILATKVHVYCRRDVFPGEQLLEFQQKVNVVKSQVTRVDGPEYTLSRYIDGNTELAPMPEVFGGGIIRARTNMLEGRAAQDAFSSSTSNQPSSDVKITRSMLASSLLNLFLQSAGLRMTDARDRLYGILGLATDIAHGPPLEINYDASPVWVYAQVFRHFVHRYKSLSFLCFDRNNFKGNYVSREHFPSWMPHADINWSNVNASRACGAMLAAPFAVSIDAETLSLHAQGIKVDTIEHVADVEYSGDGPGWIPIPSWLDQVESFCRKTWPDIPQGNDPLHEREDVTALMFPWLSAARYKAMWKLDKPDPPRRALLIRSLLAAARKADQEDLSTGDIMRGGYNPTSIIPPDVRQECYPLHVQINSVKLISTEASRIGNIAKTSGVRAGDEIWVLFGCRMPLVVRPKGLRYEVIGPVVVPGLMRGEAVEVWQKLCEDDAAANDKECRSTAIILD